MKFLKYFLVALLSLLLGAGGMYAYYATRNGDDPGQEQCDEEKLDTMNAIGEVYFQKVGITENDSTQLHNLLITYGVNRRDKVEYDSNTGGNNMYAILYGKTDVTDVAVYNIDPDKAMALEFEWERYIEQNEPETSLGTISDDQVLVLRVLETESIPVSLITFAIGNQKYYWIIQYDGKGDKKIIEDIHELS
ncbi:MAG: hypothetical protein ACRDBX_03210 [Erysipelotrichaceae bacterium]